MIKYQAEFEGYIRDNGVGSNDRVADSVKSYVSYLNSVSKYLGISINAKILSAESDIDILSDQLTKTGKVSVKTIKNYRSAMRQYVNMVNGI
jgi:uncharacterized FlgJ-related protein